jgi:hypothetical protein
MKAMAMLYPYAVSFRRRLARTAWVMIAFALAVLVPAHASADASALLRSLVIPGSGQAHQGNYARAAMFAGAAVASGVGLVVTQVIYNQSVDKYRNQKRLYLSYQTDLDAGKIVSITTIDDTYRSMQGAFNEADYRYKWRNTFLVSFIATYSLNLVDVIISRPHNADTALKYRLEADEHRVLLTRSFRF